MPLARCSAAACHAVHDTFSLDKSASAGHDGMPLGFTRSTVYSIYKGPSKITYESVCSLRKTLHLFQQPRADQMFASEKSQH